MSDAVIRLALHFEIGNVVYFAFTHVLKKIAIFVRFKGKRHV